MIVHHEPFYTDRHPAWNRIPLLLQHLQNYTHIAYIDADAFFYKESENIFRLCCKDNDFYFSNDKGVDRINSGFFIVKNSAYAHKFLEKWAYDEELYQTHKYSPFWDQSALNDLYDSNFESIQERSIIYDYGTLQHFNIDEEFDPIPYIYHAVGKTKEYRVDAFRKYISYL
jgi:lipopolysaccharide biosynthesis glycosyltransferase